MPELEAFRIASWDTPLRVNAHRSAGRFNDVGSEATQYLSLHPLTPWAEYLRNQDLREIDEVEGLRLRVWAVRAIVPKVAVIDFNEADAWGISPEDLIDDDHAACRELADRLRADPMAPLAIEVPSAALPGTRNLVIFGERVRIPYSWEPIDDVDLPAAPIVEGGKPPVELLQAIRWPGDPHAEFEAWREGRRYSFDDLEDLGGSNLGDGP